MELGRSGSEPDISVVVPSYNKPDYLVFCLRSIQQQTLTNWECIVVDDCSPMGYKIKAAVEGMADPRFRLIRHEVNRGLAAARNTGVRHAKAPLVIWIDEDDLMVPECLETLRKAQVLTGATIICPQAQFFGGTNSRKQVCSPSRETILKTMLMIPGCFLVQKEVFYKIGEFDEHPIIKHGREDHEWWIRAVFADAEIHVCTQVLHLIRKPITKEDEVRSLDMGAMSVELQIYKYIIGKHIEKYQAHPSAKLHVVKKAIRRQIYCQERMRMAARLRISADVFKVLGLQGSKIAMKVLLFPERV